MGTLVGHETVMALLDRTVKDGHPAHAYLFTGQEGVGKKKAAVQFACMLNCPDPTRDPVGTCHVCRRIAAHNHPDFMMEAPERGIIRIDRIRNLRNYFRYAPAEARYRVMVMDDAHTMNVAAQNALLKTLEEPPIGRLLILVTSKPYLLLPTVRSRCRRVHFGPISFEALTELLEHDMGIQGEKAQALAAISCGSVSRALEMNASSILELREKVLAWLENPGQMGLAGLIELSANVSEERKKALDAIDVARAWVRDLLVEKTGGRSDGSVYRHSLDRIRSAAQHHGIEELLSVYDELTRAADLIEAEINVNPNLVTDVMFLRITRILAGPNLGIA
jgi:DNA polymerase-3 subunit delta'